MNKIIVSNHGNEEGQLMLSDGTVIDFVHDQDCCEDVYADIQALKDTGFEDDMTITKQTLKFELVEGYGIRMNGYGIPCYNKQNGYYSDHITVSVNGEQVLSFFCDSDLKIYEEC